MTEVDIQTFKDNILELDNVKKAIKEYKTGLKELCTKEKELQAKSITFMETKGIDVCNMNDGKYTLRHCKRVVVDVKKSNLPGILGDFFMTEKGQSNEEATKNVSAIMEFIQKNYSKSTETMSLVRTHARTL